MLCLYINKFSLSRTVGQQAWVHLVTLPKSIRITYQQSSNTVVFGEETKGDRNLQGAIFKDSLLSVTLRLSLPILQMKKLRPWRQLTYITKRQKIWIPIGGCLTVAFLLLLGPQTTGVWLNGQARRSILLLVHLFLRLTEFVLGLWVFKTVGNRF